MESEPVKKDWSDATDVEILQARVGELESGLEHLKSCVEQAFSQCVSFSPLRPEAVLDDEWSK